MLRRASESTRAREYNNIYNTTVSNTTLILLTNYFNNAQQLERTVFFSVVILHLYHFQLFILVAFLLVASFPACQELLDYKASKTNWLPRRLGAPTEAGRGGSKGRPSAVRRRAQTPAMKALVKISQNSIEFDETSADFLAFR